MKTIFGRVLSNISGIIFIIIEDTVNIVSLKTNLIFFFLERFEQYIRRIPSRGKFYHGKEVSSARKSRVFSSSLALERKTRAKGLDIPLLVK